MRRVQKLTNHLTLKKDLKENNVSNKEECPYFKKYYKPVKVLVTGGAGNIAYSILFGIGRGKLLGPNTPIELRLLDIPPMEQKQKGVVLELKDCSFPLLKSIKATVNYKEAFEDIDIALLIGARPRGKGMVRADLLKANAKIFEGQGKAIEKYASRNVKVVVVGNPANTNCLITLKNAPSIPKQNFTALTRLDQNRAIGLICDKLNEKNGNNNVNVSDVKNVIIWGNHSKTQFPDVNFGFIDNYPKKGLKTNIRTAINNDYYLNNDFIKRVQYRGAEIIKVRGLSSAASAANATLDHIRNWINGTITGQIVSMGVYSNGEYGIPKDIIYSMPCQCSNGNINIVKGLPLNDESKELLDKTAQELLNERKTALGY